MIKFLLKTEAIFVCKRCGNTTEILVPDDGESIEQSYCCKARYRITNTEDTRGGSIFIERIADDDDKKIINEYRPRD